MYKNIRYMHMVHCMIKPRPDSESAHQASHFDVGRSHGGGDNFSAKGDICENCNFFSQIKYFFTKQLLSVINTICKKNIQKLQIN